MFPGLGHDAIVCRNHKQNQVDRRYSGHHILYQLFMTGNINNGNIFRKMGKSQINRDSPLLFFF